MTIIPVRHMRKNPLASMIPAVSMKGVTAPVPRPDRRGCGAEVEAPRRQFVTFLTGWVRLVAGELESARKWGSELARAMG